MKSMSILFTFILALGELVESQNSSRPCSNGTKVLAVPFVWLSVNSGSDRLCDPILTETPMPFSVVFCVVHGGVPWEAPMPLVLSRILHLVLRLTRLSFVLVCSQAHVLRPCRHPFCPLLCRRPHLAETRQRDKAVLAPDEPQVAQARRGEEEVVRLGCARAS